MATPIDQSSVQIHPPGTLNTSTPTMLQLATSLIESFDGSDISLEDFQIRTLSFLNELSINLIEDKPNLEEAREVFAKLLSRSYGDIPTLALISLLEFVLAPGTLTYDLKNSQAQALLELECILSETIKHFLRMRNKNQFVLELLDVYETILEHLWLLPYLSADQEVHTIIVQLGVPPLLHRTKEMMSLLEKVEPNLSEFQTKLHCLTKTYNRLETPLHPKLVEKIQQLSLDDSDPSIFGQLAEIYQHVQDNHRAVVCYEKAIFLLGDDKEELGPDLKKLQGLLYENLGNVQESLSNYSLAIGYHEKCLGIAQALDDPARESAAYGNLGNTYQRLDNYSLAVKYYAKSLEIAKIFKDLERAGTTYLNLGNLHTCCCNYPRAIEYLEGGLAIAKSSNDQASECAAYVGLGNVHRCLGKTSLALEYYEKALAIALALGKKEEEGAVCANLAIVHSSLGEIHRSVEYHEKGLMIASALGDQKAMGKISTNLGNDHFSLGKYHQAIKFHEKSLAIAQATGVRSLEGRSNCNLGNAYCCLGQISKAIDYQKKYLKIAIELGELDSIRTAHHNLGRFYTELKDFASSEEHYRIGIAVYSHIQHSLGAMYPAKITIFENYFKTYFGLERTLLFQHKYADALVISDSRRAGTLIDRIKAKDSLSEGPCDAPMQIAEMQELAGRLGTTFVVYRFDPHRKANQAFGIWIIHFGQEIEYRNFEAPSIYSAIHGAGITPFHDMDTSKARGVEDLLASLPNSQLVNEVEKEKIPILKNWYNELIAPILAVLPTEQDARITLVPDGPLMDLPFALLMDPEEKYLFEKYTISITPSIKTLHLLTQREISPSEKNLIVGNPKAPKKSSLPFAIKEAQKVAEVTGTSLEHIFVEAEALKTTILSMLEGSRFIHLACHGEVEAKEKHSIYDGAFYLTPDEEDPEGILYAEEIVDCDLSAELVFLSACHSGKGRQQQEGVIGPVRSFLAAGAQVVVATLWTLPDRELTIAMVSQFYKHVHGTSEIAQEMGRSLDKDEALREVMRMAATGPARNRPQEWGAFFMTGALKPLSQSATIGLNKGKEEEG